MAPMPPSRSFPTTSYLPSRALPEGGREELKGALSGGRTPGAAGGGFPADGTPPPASPGLRLCSRCSNIPSIGCRRADRAGRLPVARALGVALEAIRVDRVRTRAALVALALAMSIVMCLTTLVERGRAATIRSLERAGLKNLYLVGRKERSSGDGLTRSDAERLRAVLPVRADAALKIERVDVTIHGTSLSAPLYAVSGSWKSVFGARAANGRLLGDLDAARQSSYCVLG